MRTREAQLLRTIADMSYKTFEMYRYDDHEELASHIVYEVATQLNIPTSYLEATQSSDIQYVASFNVRIGRHSICVPRLFMAGNNREAILKARNLAAHLFPGEPSIDDNGVYFFSGGEVAVKLEKLVTINPFDFSVEVSTQKEAA